MIKLLIGVSPPARYPQVRQSTVPPRCAHPFPASSPAVDKPVETVDRRVIAGPRRSPNLHRVPQTEVLNWVSTAAGRVPARCRRPAGCATAGHVRPDVPDSIARLVGDSGVLPGAERAGTCAIGSAWCPRCNGALMAPDPRWTARPRPADPRPAGRSPAGPPPVAQRQAPRLPSGFRWIAGTSPDRRPRRAAGADRSDRPCAICPSRAGAGRPVLPTATGTPPSAPVRRRPPCGPPCWRRSASSAWPPSSLNVVRYVLLLINRTSLLPPLVATAALWLGVVVSRPRSWRSSWRRW